MFGVLFTTDSKMTSYERHKEVKLQNYNHLDKNIPDSVQRRAENVGVT